MVWFKPRDSLDTDHRRATQYLEGEVHNTKWDPARASENLCVQFNRDWYARLTLSEKAIKATYTKFSNNKKRENSNKAKKELNDMRGGQASTTTTTTTTANPLTEEESEEENAEEITVLDCGRLPMCDAIEE